MLSRFAFHAIRQKAVNGGRSRFLGSRTRHVLLAVHFYDLEDVAHRFPAILSNGDGATAHAFFQDVPTPL